MLQVEPILLNWSCEPCQPIYFNYCGLVVDVYNTEPENCSNPNPTRIDLPEVVIRPGPEPETYKIILGPGTWRPIPFKTKAEQILIKLSFLLLTLCSDVKIELPYIKEPSSFICQALYLLPYLGIFSSENPSWFKKSILYHIIADLQKIICPTLTRDLSFLTQPGSNLTPARLRNIFFGPDPVRLSNVIDPSWADLPSGNLFSIQKRNA